LGSLTEQVTAFLRTAETAPTYDSLADYFGYDSAWQVFNRLRREGTSLRDLLDKEREMRLFKYNFRTARQAYKTCMFRRDDHFSAWYKARYGMPLHKHRKYGGVYARL